MQFIPRLLRCSAVLAGLASVLPASAGTVNVSFAETTRFTDAGTSQWDERANVDALGRYMQSLGQRLLPADHVLKVEVLDLDLAGTVVPSRRDGDAIRVVRGRADIPRMHLRYTLDVPGQAARSGDEWITDLNFGRGVSRYKASQPLYYEKQMLQSWFTQRFVRPD